MVDDKLGLHFGFRILSAFRCRSVSVTTLSNSRISSRVSLPDWTSCDIGLRLHAPKAQDLIEEEVPNGALCRISATDANVKVVPRSGFRSVQNGSQLVRSWLLNMIDHEERNRPLGRF